MTTAWKLSTDADNMTSFDASGNFIPVTELMIREGCASEFLLFRIFDLFFTELNQESTLESKAPPAKKSRRLA
jgi:hypothetical protein